MNRLRYLILPVWLIYSCVGKHSTETPAVIINNTNNTSVIGIGDTIHLNCLRSSINWAATEMRGLKKRTGKISISKGYLLNVKGETVGGHFIVDMETMDVTDMPAHEVTARSNLIAHLKSADFFDTTRYPVATLALTDVEKVNNDHLKISGNLTIRDVTKNISFFAQKRADRIISKFTFNRLQFKVSYTGNWAAKTLVDDDIELAIELVFE